MNGSSQCHFNTPVLARLLDENPSPSDLTALASGSKRSAVPDPAGPEPVAPGRSPRMLQRTVRKDNICVLTFDRPGSSANIFDEQTLAELAEELDSIAADPSLKGLVLTSAKRSIFVAGVDLHAMSSAANVLQVDKLIELGQAVMNRLAELSIPTVAAVHGAALGGGYELCLACDYRVASSDRGTRLGLPETQLGLLPGWGGCTRLPRLIGVPKALDIILGGKTLAAKQALKRGLVDQVVPAEYLVDAAVRVIGQEMPARKTHWALNNGLLARALGIRLRRQLLKKTRGNYPAIMAALEVITRGIARSIPQSLALERIHISELIRSSACRNLVRVFLLQERAKKLSLPSNPGAEPKPIKSAAVIGAGVMGAGIAQWLSSRELRVILRDIDAGRVAGGMATISRLYQEGLKRRVFSALEVRAGMDRIFPAPSEVSLRRADIVIEAAVEKLELKKNIFQRLDELAGDDTILVSNTSALPISDLAAATRRPERVLGLHFFNPVHRMQLVEIVAARQTSPEVLRRALRFVQQIGKLPVLVKDSPGFLVNRILMPYLLEAGNLFETGSRVTDLDTAMLDFGMPMGPMRLLDEVGIDVALHVAQTLASSFPGRIAVPQSLTRMAQDGLLGRKSGRGFYLHTAKKEPRPNAVISAVALEHSAAGLSGPQLQERMVLLMINEAARCLEEQIVAEPADVDFAMIMGTGFAPFRGGPLRYADATGIANLVGAMQRLKDAGQPHFEPCALLQTMARGNQNFYKESRNL